MGTLLRAAAYSWAAQSYTTQHHGSRLFGGKGALAVWQSGSLLSLLTSSPFSSFSLKYELEV